MFKYLFTSIVISPFLDLNNKVKSEISLLSSGLDKMLGCALEYSNKWRFTFNATKTVILTFGESYRDHSVNRSIRDWQLGSRVISEKESWFNLGKIWHINNESSAFVSKAVTRGREAGMVLMKMGAHYGGLNPIISVELWKWIGRPKMLYGCELWQLNRQDIFELEEVQNITVHIMQGFVTWDIWICCSRAVGFITN